MSRNGSRNDRRTRASNGTRNPSGSSSVDDMNVLLAQQPTIEEYQLFLDFVNTVHERHNLPSPFTGPTDITHRVFYEDLGTYNNSARNIARGGSYNNNASNVARGGSNRYGQNNRYGHNNGSNVIASRGANNSLSSRASSSHVGSIYGNRDGYTNNANHSRSAYGNRDGYTNIASHGRSAYGNRGGYTNTASHIGSVYGNHDGFTNTASHGGSIYGNRDGYTNTTYGRGNGSGSSNQNNGEDYEDYISRRGRVYRGDLP